MAKLTINQVLQQAVDAHKAGQSQEAHRLYAAILKVQPKHPDANHNTGLLTVGFGKIELALPFFKTALEANPSNAQFWYSHIVALIKLERLIDAKALLDQAKSKGIKGADFDQLEQKLNDVDAYYNMGIALQKQNKLEEAIVAYNKALSIKPDYVEAYYNMGIALQVQNKLEEAIEAYNKTIALKPDNADAYYNMGIALKEQGKLEEAIVAYNKALSIKPDYADTYYNMGIALKEQGKLEGAIEAYNKALSIKPNYADTYYNMGIALKEQGKLEEAIEAYNKALSIKPNYAKAYNNMGVALQDQGNLEEAIEAYNKALSIKPDYAETYYNMGITLEEQGNLEEAIEAYNKAIAIKPNYAGAKDNLVETLKIYSPKNGYVNQLIDVDSKIKTKHNKHALPKADRELATYTLDLLNELKAADKNLSTKNLQIYRRNNVDLNCKRHMEIFEEKKIIPKFCFSCYKVQVDVTTVLDLIRLAALFYVSEFESDLTRKCFVEVRPNIPGSYKGLIYCRGIDQANIVKKQLDVHVKNIDKNLIAKIKKGCSEFSLAFPEYGKVAESEVDMMQFPQEWQALETEFDDKNLIMSKTHSISSLKEFCLSDYLIIQKWIDYAKGIGDPTSELFCDFPVKYDKIMEVAMARVKQ